jgi:hypothetical protein
MATQVSPGIRISEIDNTLTLGQVALTEGAIAGNFQWGPVDKVVTISSEDGLVKQFGKPDANSADYFFTAANFLAYSNSLRVVRVVNTATALAATANANGTILTSTATFTVSSSANVITAATGNTSGLFPGLTLTLANSLSNTITLTILAVTNSTSATTTSTPTEAVTTGNVYAFGVYVKNEDHYESTFADGSGNIGPVAAKHVGVLGNSLRVEICSGANAYSQTPAQTITVASGTTVTASANIASFTQVGDIITANGEDRLVATLAANGTEFTVNAAFSTALTTQAFTRKWRYASLFSSAPGTSDWATQRGGSADELHVVVVDEDGAFTGAANTVLEKFSHLSKAADAKKDTGGSNYYAAVLNRQSAYVWWFDHPTGGTYWGNQAAGTTFAKIALIGGYSLKGGTAGGSLVAADLYRGNDLFADELLEASLILGASASSTVASYIINNVVLAKKFSMGFFSPSRATVVDNAGDEVTDIVAYRDALPSTSFAVLDSGWKYQYDKYNDVYRFVPLNGDVAGCCVRTDQVSEPWFSPAGFTRGQIKNVVKLAFNPTQADRDDLYRNGVNPVVSFPGQGTILFGDKTLLSKPSAFDRINVRRLFVQLEKTVERSAKQQLFEQNDSFTRASFVNMVEPYLRSVKGRRGISDYFVVCDESNNPADAIDRNEFRADVFIKPIHSINFISLQFVVVRSDVAFTEVITNLG